MVDGHSSSGGAVLVDQIFMKINFSDLDFSLFLLQRNRDFFGGVMPRELLNSLIDV